MVYYWGLLLIYFSVAPWMKMMKDEGKCDLIHLERLGENVLNCIGQKRRLKTRRKIADVKSPFKCFESNFGCVEVGILFYQRLSSTVRRISSIQLWKDRIRLQEINIENNSASHSEEHRRIQHLNYQNGRRAAAGRKELEVQFPLKPFVIRGAEGIRIFNFKKHR